MTSTPPDNFFQALLHNGWRSVVLIKGQDKWRSAVAESIIQGQAWSTGIYPDTLSATNKHIQAYLGQELDFVWLDNELYFDVDALCALAGCIRHGGCLILSLSEQFIEQDKSSISGLAHPYNKLQSIHSYYFARLWQLSAQQQNSVMLEEAKPIRYPEITKGIEQFTKPEGLTITQLNILQQISEIATHGHYFIKADRGRGKSTLLAALVNHYAKQQQKIHITAPAKRCIKTIISWLETWQTATDNYQFVAPDALTSTTPADILIVDEAAALPSQLLKTISSNYAFVIYATTEQGYEGSGKGLSQHFIKQLQRDKQLVKAFELTKPIRWAENDPLENWLNQICMPNTAPPANSEIDSKLVFRFLEQSELATNNDLLTQVYSLLFEAHYRTTPTDLKFIMDSPALKLCVAQNHHGQIIAAVLISVEGGLAPELVEQIAFGKRRPNGHLAPQIIAAQLGVTEFAQLIGWRIVRIAVHVDFRRQKIASTMLNWLQASASQCTNEQSIDYLATSFAASRHVSQFWQKNKFNLARVSTTAEHHSGLFSTLYIKPILGDNSHIFAAITSACQQQLQYYLSSHYQAVEACLLDMWQAQVSKHTPLDETSSQANRLLMTGFAYQQTNYFAALPAIDNFVQNNLLFVEQCLTNEEFRLLNAAVTYKISPTNLALTHKLAEQKLTGQKHVIKSLRLLISKLLDQL